MIFASAVIRTMPGKRDRFLALAGTMIQAARKEGGNIHHELLASALSSPYASRWNTYEYGHGDF